MNIIRTRGRQTNKGNNKKEHDQKKKMKNKTKDEQEALSVA